MTVHCPNSGSMKTCWEPGWEVRISDSGNPKRKLRYTLEMVHNGRCWIGVHTGRTNGLIREAVASGSIEELRGYTDIQTERPYGKNSRIDLLLQDRNRRCYVEVKHVTLVEDGRFQFPDAVTTRGQKHLVELMNVVRAGHRAVAFFAVHRSDARGFKTAGHIDADYAGLFEKALLSGVEAVVYRVEVDPQGLWVDERVSIVS